MLLQFLRSFKVSDKEAERLEILSVSELGADQLGTHLLVHQLTKVSELVAIRDKRKHHFETTKLASKRCAGSRRGLGGPLLKKLVHSIGAVENDHGLTEDVERADGSIEFLVLGPVLVLSCASGWEVEEVTDDREGLRPRWKRQTSLLLGEQDIVNNECGESHSRQKE